MERFALSCAACAILLAGCGGDALNQPTDMAGGGDDSGLLCGNGVVDPGEQCDNGAANDVHGSGCEPDCTFTCVIGGVEKCSDGDPCNGVETCGMDHKCHSGTPLMNGAPCGTNKSCKNGVCGDITCGDGIVDGSEECDDGNLVEGDGCDNDCRFSCVSTDMTRNCTPHDPCKGQGTCNDMTHVCAPGVPLMDGASCG